MSAASLSGRYRAFLRDVFFEHRLKAARTIVFQQTPKAETESSTMLIFLKENGHRFEVGCVQGISLISKEQFPRADAAILTISGRHGLTKTTLSDRLYFIVAGSGTFTVNDETASVGCNSVVVIPKDTPYDFDGKMSAIVFSTPAFDPEYEVALG
jgi:mannose-6-phosphate isomerase-like protein (cupin superfamily)